MQTMLIFMGGAGAELQASCAGGGGGMDGATQAAVMKQVCPSSSADHACIRQGKDGSPKPETLLLK